MGKKRFDIEEQLRQAILKSKLTRYRLAKLTGVSQGVLSNFINRHRSLALPTAAKLAAGLGLELRPRRKESR